VSAHFGEHAVTTLFGNAAEAAAAAHILAYLRETFPDSLKSLQRVRPLAESATLALDARTLRNLDVFASEGRQSLFGVLNVCQTAMGSRLLREWLQRPLRAADPLAA